MALRQLAGPFTITDRDGNFPSAVTGWRWYPDVGIMTLINNQQCFMTVDGIYQPINSSRPSLYGYWPAKKRWMTWNMPAENKEYILDPKSLTMLTIDDTDKVIDGFFFRDYIKLADRRIYFVANQMYKIINKATTLDSDGRLPFLWGLVGPGRTDTEIFLVETGDIQNHAPTVGDTRCCFYDTLTKTYSPLMYLGMACHGAIFATELGVIISLHDGPPLTLRVWSTEVKPSTLSTPTVLENTPKGGLITTYQVQALGTQSEPCVGELIDWQVFGVGNPIGSQSTTDENGHATMRVVYKVDDTGESLVQAKLVC